MINDNTITSRFCHMVVEGSKAVKIFAVKRKAAIRHSTASYITKKATESKWNNRKKEEKKMLWLFLNPNLSICLCLEKCSQSMQSGG